MKFSLIITPGFSANFKIRNIIILSTIMKMFYILMGLHECVCYMCELHEYLHINIQLSLNYILGLYLLLFMNYDSI